VGILQNHAQRTAQLGLVAFLHIDPVVGHLSLLNVIEPVQKVGNRRLSGAGRTDKRDLLAGLRIQVHIAEYIGPPVVGERDVVQPHIAAQRDPLGRSVRIRPFPCP